MGRRPDLCLPLPRVALLRQIPPEPQSHTEEGALRGARHRQRRPGVLHQRLAASERGLPSGQGTESQRFGEAGQFVTSSGTSSGGQDGQGCSCGLRTLSPRAGPGDKQQSTCTCPADPRSPRAALRDGHVESAPYCPTAATSPAHVVLFLKIIHLCPGKEENTHVIPATEKGTTRERICLAASRGEPGLSS